MQIPDSIAGGRGGDAFRLVLYCQDPRCKRELANLFCHDAAALGAGAAAAHHPTVNADTASNKAHALLGGRFLCVPCACIAALRRSEAGEKLQMTAMEKQPIRKIKALVEGLNEML